MDTKPFTPIALNAALRAQIIRDATTRVVFAGPGIGYRELSALAHARRRLQDGAVRILVDFSAEAVRGGYWADLIPDRLEELEEIGADTEIGKGLRLGLLIVDNQSFIYTPTPQSIEPERALSAEPNGLRLNEEETQRLVESVLSTSDSGEAARPMLTTEAIKSLQSELKKETVVLPDRTRLLGYLRRRIKIVQFETKGYQLGRRKLQLPKEIIEALGSDRDEINRRLTAAWRLFSLEDDKNKDVAALQKNVEKGLTGLKERYLKRLGNYGYGLIDTVKEEFEAEWTTFQQDQVKKYKDALNARVDAMIQASKSLLGQLLHEQYKKGTLHLPPVLTLYVTSEKARAKEHISKLIEIVKWPSSAQVAGNVSIKMHEFDITQTLLDDKEFVALLEKAFEFQLADLQRQHETEQNPAAVAPFSFSLN